MRKVREIARVRLIVRNLDLNPLCWGMPRPRGAVQ